MARAADRGKVIVTTPSRSWPVASTVLLIGLVLGYLMAEIGSSSGEGPDVEAAVAVDGGAGHGGTAAGADDEPAGAGQPRDGGAGGGSADGAESAPELTTGGGAAGSGDQAPATPPLELGPYSSVEWERQQAVWRRAGQDIDAALRPIRELLTRSRYDFRFHVEEFERIRDLLRAEVHDHGTIYEVRAGPMERRVKELSDEVAELKRRRVGA